MGTLFPQVVDLLRPGVDYADHLRRIAERALTEIEQPRVEKLRLRPDPAAELIREPLIFRRRDGGWLQLEEQPVGEEGFTSLWTDVTRRMNAEAQANRLQERLSDAIEEKDRKRTRLTSSQ